MLSVAIGVQHTEVPNLGVTLFDGYSYDGLNAVIGVQHTEIPNLGVVSDVFLDRWLLLLSVAIGV